MLKKFLPIALLLSSQSAFAAVNELPTQCDYGRQTNYDVEASDVVSAVQDGLSVYANPYDVSEWASFVNSLASLLDSFDYLRVETPKHILRGLPFRAKGNLFDIYANVNFYNSEKGYIGKDKSNLDANSYKEMSFDKTHGYGLVWVSRGGMCSAEGVWIQAQKPSLQTVSLEYGKAVVRFNIDKYSKAALNSTTKTTIKLRGFSPEGSKIEHHRLSVDGQSGTVRLNFSSDYHCENFRIYADISDGTYSNSVYLGTVTGGSGAHRPCPSCEVDV